MRLMHVIQKFNVQYVRTIYKQEEGEVMIISYEDLQGSIVPTVLA
jgi:hypothetical protein